MGRSRLSSGGAKKCRAVDPHLAAQLINPRDFDHGRQWHR